MNITIRSIFIGIAAIVVFSGVITVVVIWGENFYYIQELQLKSQKRKSWCWAASIQMIHDYKKKYISADTISQCQIVRERDICEGQEQIRGPFYIPFNDSDTCGCKNSFCSNKGLGNVGIYAKVFNKFNVQVDSVEGMFSWAKVKSELIADKPFMLHNIEFTTRIGPLATGPHVVVVGGFVETSSLRLLLINDPWEKCKGCTYLLNYDILPTSNVGLRNLRTIFLNDSTSSSRTIATRARESIYSLKSNFNRFFSRDNQNDSVEVFINRIIDEISSTSPEILKRLGFSSAQGIRKIPQQNIINLRIFDEEKILSNDSSKLEDYLKKTDVYKVYPIQNDEGGMTTIMVRRVNNGGNNFWIIDNITKCDGFQSIAGIKEVYQLNTPDQNYLFEATNNTLLRPLNNYTDPFDNLQGISANKAKKSQTYSYSEIINFLKPILITYNNGK